LVIHPINFKASCPEKLRGKFCGKHGCDILHSTTQENIATPLPQTLKVFPPAILPCEYSVSRCKNREFEIGVIKQRGLSRL
jgi:hypothetical protein